MGRTRKQKKAAETPILSLPDAVAEKRRRKGTSEGDATPMTLQESTTPAASDLTGPSLAQVMPPALPRVEADRPSISQAQPMERDVMNHPLLSSRWREILPNNSDAIPDTLRRSIRDKCIEIEGVYQPILKLRGSPLEEAEIWNKYEDLGKKVLSDEDTPDWKNVEENLQRMYNEYIKECISGIKEEDKWLRRFTLEETIPKAIESRQNRFSMTQGNGRLAHDDGEPKRKIQVKVKTVKGVEHVFKEMSTRDLILDFKRKIASQIGGMVEDEIILLYGDKELCDNDTLDTYGITNGGTVFMLHRLRGKGLMETARFLYNEAWNVLKYLGDLVPGLFADCTRALTTKELSKVAQAIGKNWELLGPALGLDSILMDHITEDNPNSTIKKIYTMLTTWLNENQSEATVGKLYQAMHECKEVCFNWTKIKNIFSGVDAVFLRG